MANSLPEDLVAVARVVGAYGVLGAVRVEPYSPQADALFSAKAASWLQTTSSVRTPCKLTSLRWQGAQLIVHISGISTRDAADALRGAQIFVSRADFPRLPAGEYYWTDLIGCDVTDQSNTLLGVVADVVDFGAHPLLQVRGAETSELIPFVAAHVGEVDIAMKKIRVSWCAPE